MVEVVMAVMKLVGALSLSTLTFECVQLTHFNKLGHTTGYSNDTLLLTAWWHTKSTTSYNLICFFLIQSNPDQCRLKLIATFLKSYITAAWISWSLWKSISVKWNHFALHKQESLFFFCSTFESHVIHYSKACNKNYRKTTDKLCNI